MFSSFSKLLPTNVTIGTPDFLKNHNPLAQGSNSSASNGHSSAATAQQTPQAQRELPSRTDTAESQDAVTRDSPRKDGKKKRKEVAATETFIIVRPPPSKSNHPLNLQVQLVPTGRERIQRRSVSSNFGNRSNNASRETVNTLNDGTTGNGLERSTSIRSDNESTYSASSNLSSSSTVSGTGSSRRIIPLYNLHAHNVMTNVITDAGTDAKIAKFFKRGLEIMGLAMLEPVEVYGRYRWSDSFDALDRDITINIARTGSHMSNTSTSTSRPGTAGGTTGANAANGSNGVTHHELEPVVEVPSSPSTPKGDKENATKKLFGGLFKKKKEPPSPLPLGVRGHRNTRSIGEGPLTPSVLVSAPAPPSAPATPSVPRTPTIGPVALPSGPEMILQPQILGLQAILQSSVNPPKGRPTTYVWVIRKWIKASNEGLLGAVADTLGLPGINMIIPGGSGSGSAQGSAISNIGGPANPGPTECEVRFEWKRGNKVLKSAAAAANAAKASEEERQERQRKRLSRAESPTRKPRNESPSKKNRFSIQVDPARRGSVQVDEQGAGALLSVGAAGAISPPSKRMSFQGFGKKNPQPTQQPSSESLRPANLSPNPNQRSGSPNPPASVATSVNTDDNSHAPRENEEESDDDSDPEDSERPWNCYIHVRRAPFYRARGSRTSLAGAGYPQPAQHRPQGEEGEEEESLDIKLRVACLMPAPHHPKVIAQVKTPYPLPDIVFDRPSYTLPAHGSGFSKYANIFSSNSAQDSASNTTSSRFSNASGNKPNANENGNIADSNGHGQVDNLSVRRPGARLRPRDPDVSRTDLEDPQGPNAPLVLTAEEIKDVVSCTGLWLVVREGYGGLAKKRKGDGWRLRG